MPALLARTDALSLEIERRLGWLPACSARLVVGWVFLESGWGKLHDLEAVTRYFTELGIPAPQLHAPFVASTEFVCGALLLAGLLTRFAALPLVAVMTVALATALRDRITGLSDLFGLAELCYIVLLSGLIVFGAGPLSLDTLVSRRVAKRVRSQSQKTRVIPTRAPGELIDDSR